MFEIHASLIEKILKQFENDESINITNMMKSPACEKGENFMSVVVRVHLDGTRIENNNQIEYSTTLIVKRPYQSEIMQSMFNSTQIFMNEVIAYNQIIPTLKETYNIKLPIADCLYADNNIIVLEDLGADDFDMIRNEVCMTVDQCLAVLQELAVFHAASIIFKHKQPEKIEKLSTQVVEIYRPDNKNITNLVNKNISVALTLLKSSEQTADIIKAIDILEIHKDEIFLHVSELFKTKNQTAVFNHGDCWRNNILFKFTSGCIKVKLVDLQVMRYTSVGADLDYFLYINLIPDDRHRNYDLFIDTYLNALHRAISDHKIDIDTQIYSREWLIKEMEDFAVFGFMCSLWISPAFYYDKSKLPDMENIKPEELDASYHQHFILKHMTPGLKDRIVSLVLDFVNSNKF